MIVEATTSGQRYVRQTIITSNNPTNRILYRNSYEGAWVGSAWNAMTPSNYGSLNTTELEDYWKVQHTSYSNRLAKRNAVVSISINSKIDELIAERSVLLELPFDIVETGSESYYVLAFADGINYPITLYTNRNTTTNKTEIKNFNEIPADTTIRAFITLVEEKF